MVTDVRPLSKAEDKTFRVLRASPESRCLKTALFTRIKFIFRSTNESGQLLHGLVTEVVAESCLFSSREADTQRVRYSKSLFTSSVRGKRQWPAMVVMDAQRRPLLMYRLAKLGVFTYLPRRI